MEQKINNYKKIYKIAIILTLIGFIDSIIIPILFKTIPIFSGGLLPLSFGFLFGNAGITIGVLLINVWFIFGIVAIALNSEIKKLEKKLVVKN